MGAESGGGTLIEISGENGPGALGWFLTEVRFKVEGLVGREVYWGNEMDEVGL